MRTTAFRVLAAGAAALVAGAALSVVSATSASAAEIAPLVITPAAGSNTATWSYAAPSACPAPANRYQVKIDGANFPANFSLIGTTNLAIAAGPFAQTPQGYMDAFGTAPKVLTGDYIIKVVCGSLSGLTFTPTGDTFSTTINFATPTAYTTVVTAQATNTTLAASVPSPQLAGTPVTFTATVAPAAATGTVQFTVDGAPVGAPVAVAGGTASFTTSALAVGNRSIGASFTGGAGFNNSAAAALPYTITAAPAQATASALTVSPVSGPAFQSVTLTGAVTNTTVPANTPAGSCAFKNGTTTIATIAVSATGACVYTSTSFGSGTYAFSFDFVPAGNFLPSTSNTVAATYAGYNCVTGDQCVDPQTVVVTVPAGNISINTPYTPATPFNLGTLVLAANGTSYSASNTFGSAADPASGVAIVDTRAGALPFNAQIASTNFTNGANSISNSLLGFTGLAPAYVAGNSINAGTNPIVLTNRPAGQISTTGATFATGTGPGSVNVYGILSLSNVPTSTAPGLYTATVTFTIS